MMEKQVLKLFGKDRHQSELASYICIVSWTNNERFMSLTPPFYHHLNSFPWQREISYLQHRPDVFTSFMKLLILIGSQSLGDMIRKRNLSLFEPKSGRLPWKHKNKFPNSTRHLPGVYPKFVKPTTSW